MQCPSLFRRSSSANPPKLAGCAFLVMAIMTAGLFAQTKVNLGNAHRSKIMTAVRVEEGAIKPDGVLDEPQWNLAACATDFIQRLPRTGEPATERTEARILYDDHNIYVGVHCYDSLGEKGIRIKDIRPDFYTLDSDGFQVIFDTFDDDRNCFLFGVNPAGARFDMQIGSDGTASNTAWNGIWSVTTRIDFEGWHLEMVIPMITLRFQKIEDQVWGVNFERRVRRKSEDSYWAPLPAAFRLGRISLAGTLEGLHDLKPGRNLQFKPYLSAAFSRRPNGDAHFKPDAGGDLKYGLGAQLTLDLTVNTDFSQVEADEEQINLTRYNLFFPEKRDFFLENASIFKVGRSRPFVSQPRPDLMPFFTRRIGISDAGHLIPVLGGARLSGRTGKYTLSMLSMETDHTEDAARTNYSMIRMRRDILKKSDIGGFFTSKLSSNGRYTTWGGDINLNFFKYLDVSSYVFRTDSPGVTKDNWASYFEVGWKDDLVDVSVRRLSVDKNFDPQMGYVSRTAMQKSSGEFALTFRPRNRAPWIRYFGPAMSIAYLTNPDNVPESKNVNPYLDIVLRNGSQIQAGRLSGFERIVKPYKVHMSQTIAPGDYRFSENYISFVSDRSHLFMGSFRISSGGFYNGERKAVQMSGDFQPGCRFRAGLSWNYNDVHLPGGNFQTNLLGARLGFAFNTANFFNALIQYNSDTQEIISNVRFNFFHTAVSDLFAVYNERRSSTGGVLDRALVIKATYTFIF